MHGSGPDIPAAVRVLKKAGFEAVVGNQPQLIAEANHAGLDAYLCSGAFGASGRFAAENYLARDINGKPQLWFNSTCPNQPEVRKANLEAAAEMAAVSGIRGILIDGARFASPASSRNPDAFYTCFCPVCAEKAEQLRYDFDLMRSAVQALYQWMRGGTAERLLPHAQGLLDWFSFRRRCTTEHLLNFVNGVKAFNPELAVGIYIFSPAIAPLVGQSYSDLDGQMDIVAPMIYRCYNAEDGPATLNHELAAVAAELSRCVFSPHSTLEILSVLTGLPLGGGLSGADIRLQGFPTDAVGIEVRRARSMLPNTRNLIPIIQLDDPMLRHSIDAALQSGADGVNFFAYDHRLLDQHAPMFEEMANRLAGQQP
jgi:hypothetical protein